MAEETDSESEPIEADEITPPYAGYRTPRIIEFLPFMLNSVSFLLFVLGTIRDFRNIPPEKRGREFVLSVAS